MSLETVDLEFVFLPETGIDLGHGDLAHEIEAPSPKFVPRACMARLRRTSYFAASFA